MCIHISRRYQCWDMTSKPGVHPRQQPGHHLDYLARCANPNPERCLHPAALPWIQEWYNFPCPKCAHTTIHPDGEPVRISRADDRQMEQRPESNEAALSYATSLIVFLGEIFRNREPDQPWYLLRKFQACRLEVSCRFEPKAHFDRGICRCNQSCEFPELRNLSVGMRYKPARDMLRAGEELETGVDGICDGLLTWCGMFSTSRADFFARSQQVFDRFKNQPAPSMINENLRGASILSAWKPTGTTSEDREMEFFKDVDQAVDDMMLSLGGRVGWLAWYRMHHEPLLNEDASEPKDVQALTQRVRLFYIIARLLYNDNGLSAGRRDSIVALMLFLLSPDDRALDNLEKPLRDGMLNLMEGRSWNLIGDDDDDPADHGSYYYYGCLFSDPTKFIQLEHSLRRNRDLGILVDTARVQAAESAIARDLTRQEFESLSPPHTTRGADRTCYVCHKDLTHGPSEPPQPGLPLGDFREHRAVYLKCGHVVGRSCWIDFWRYWEGPVHHHVGCHECFASMGSFPQELGRLEDRPGWRIVMTMKKLPEAQIPGNLSPSILYGGVGKFETRRVPSQWGCWW